MTVGVFRCIFKDGKFFPYLRHHNDLSASFEEGETVYISVDHGRSGKSHKHQFVWLRSAFESLPETLKNAPYYKNADALRKHALIETGFCTTSSLIFETNQQAIDASPAIERISKAAGLGDKSYCIVTVSGPVLIVSYAESQSEKAMGQKRFQESKTAILEWISNLIGVSPEELLKSEPGK